jgi:hypothetical protein
MFTAALKMFLGSGVVTAITDAYFNLVTLLLPGNGTNGAQNNTFLDSSSNNFTITRNGNTTQGTFSPFSQTGWGNYFNANKISTPDATNNNISSGDFTVEFWTNAPLQTSAGVRAVAFFPGFANTGNDIGWNFVFNQNGSITFEFYNLGITISTATSALNNSWNHVAATRSGNVFTLWLNGVSQGTQTASGTGNSSSAWSIFVGSTAANNVGACNNIYISNLRIVKGQSLFSGTFTPSTSALTTSTVGAAGAGAASSLTGTVGLLTCQSNRFADNSTNAFIFTPSGTPSVEAFSPFLPTIPYSAATVGGSGYFDGSGDYLATPSNAAFGFGTGDYTMECWVYPIPAGKISRLFQFSDNNDNLDINSSSISYVVGGVSYFNGSSGTGNSSAGVQNYAWNHIVLQRTSGTVRVYVNALSVLTQASTPNTSTRSLAIGGSSADATFSLFYGYISSLRVVKGTAVYSGTSTTTPNFTLPTAPLTDITNTQLLANFTNAGITDATAKNVLETLGNAAISTAQSKFGGSSMFFDGTGDYLSATPRIQSNAMGNANATIEMWVYTANSSSSLKCLVDTRSGQNTDTGFGIYQISNNVVIYGAGVKGNAASQLTGNTWVHLAVTRANTTNYVFINGTLYNTFSYGNTLTSSNVTIASDVAGSNAFTGYIDDLRITNGFARYTANFTPTTTAFPLQ